MSEPLYTLLCINPQCGWKTVRYENLDGLRCQICDAPTISKPYKSDEHRMNIEQAILELENVNLSHLPFRLQVKYSKALLNLKEISEYMEQSP